MNKQITVSSDPVALQADAQVEVLVELSPSTLDLVGGGQAITSCYRITPASSAALSHR
jgi:hypothetical protein